MGITDPFLARRFLCALAILLVSALLPGGTEAKVRVVASTTDLGSIASSVGGDQVEVVAIAKPTADVHRVEALPSYMVRVSKAKLYLKVGLGLDQWAEAIIDGSRNADLLIVDCSQEIPVLEKPTGKVDASMGDVHPGGNPHYWLDARNGGIIARTVAEALGRVDPAHAADFSARAEAFAKEAEETAARGKTLAAGFLVHEIITYHASWTYLANMLGLDVAATVEPVPGIPPTAAHLKKLVDLIRSRRLQLVIQEPYFSDDAGRFLEREAGARVMKMAPSCDSTDPGSYLAHFEAIYQALSAGQGARSPGKEARS